MPSSESIAKPRRRRSRRPRNLDPNASTRVDILKSAAAAFRRLGYHGATVEQIAAALHMKKGNLYYYFKNKEAILFACHQYSLDRLLILLEEVETAAEFAVAYSDGGYTTNLPIEDLTGGRAWIAFDYDGQPLDPEHGGPARLLVPHLYLWKSAKWVRGISLQNEDEPGFWETNGYHLRGDPWREQRYWGD